MARDGSTEAEATARIEAQMPLAEKMRRADLILDNDGASAPDHRDLLSRIILLNRHGNAAALPS